MQAKQRINHSNQSGLCLYYLQPFTRYHTCFKQVCRQCQKRHLTLLLIDRQNQSINGKGLANIGPPADARSSSTSESNSYCSFKGKPRNHILFATAILQVQNNSGQYVPRRLLLDSASQSHFITERCVQRLKFTRTQAHERIQCMSSVNTETKHRV